METPIETHAGPTSLDIDPASLKALTTSNNKRESENAVPTSLRDEKRSAPPIPPGATSSASSLSTQADEDNVEEDGDEPDEAVRLAKELQALLQKRRQLKKQLPARSEDQALQAQLTQLNEKIASVKRSLTELNDSEEDTEWEQVTPSLSAARSVQWHTYTQGSFNPPAPLDHKLPPSSASAASALSLTPSLPKPSVAVVMAPPAVHKRRKDSKDKPANRRPDSKRKSARHDSVDDEFLIQSASFQWPQFTAAAAFERKEGPVPDREKKKEEVESPDAALWQLRYFARAKACIETAVSAGRVQEINLKRFQLYLGPPTYQHKFRQYELWIIQQLEKSRAEDEHALWDAVHSEIAKIPAPKRQRGSIGVYYGQFLEGVQLAHNKWKQNCLKTYEAQVIKPAVQVLISTGHLKHNIRQRFIRPLLRQYGKQLDEIRHRFEKHAAMEQFAARKELSVLEAVVKKEAQRLETTAKAQQEKHLKAQEAISAEMTEQAEAFYTEQQEWVYTDISRLCGNGIGCDAILKWYSSSVPLSEAEKALLGKPTKSLSSSERSQLEILKRIIAKNFIIDLKACWQTGNLRQADVHDAEGNTLLHHGMERLANLTDPEHKAYFMQFITALYMHGALATMGNSKKEDVYAFSKIFQSKDAVFNTPLGWKLLNLHLTYTPVCSEAEKQAKSHILAYSAGMPSFLAQHAVLQWAQDMHGTKRNRRFEDIWEMVRALSQSEEDLNDEIFIKKVQERKQQDSRAKQSKLFESLTTLLEGVQNGKVIALQMTAEDAHAEAQEQIANMQKSFASIQGELQQFKEKEIRNQHDLQEKLKEQEEQLKREMQEKAETREEQLKREMQEKLKMQEQQLQEKLKEQEEQLKREMQAQMQAQEARIMAMFAQMAGGQSLSAASSSAASSAPLLTQAQAPLSLPGGASFSSGEMAGLHQHNFLRGEAKRAGGESDAAGLTQSPLTQDAIASPSSSASSTGSGPSLTSTLSSDNAES